MCSMACRFTKVMRLVMASGRGGIQLPVGVKDVDLGKVGDHHLAALGKFICDIIYVYLQEHVMKLWIEVLSTPVFETT